MCINLPARSDKPPAAVRHILSVGTSHDRRLAERLSEPGVQICHTSFAGVAAAYERLIPDMIVSPVFSPRFDCFDLAQLLVYLDFRGAYRAISTQLPRPYVVRNELQAVFPSVDFDILFLSDALTARPS